MSGRKRSDWGKIIELTKQGMSRLEVAEAVGVTRTTVAAALRDAGLLAKIKVKGGKRGWKRLKEQQKL